MITPLIPATSRPEACKPVAPGTSMHFRFEINLMTNTIVGSRPKINILNFAWEDKKRHVRDYIGEYYNRRHVMPAGRHDLGITEEHHLTVGIVDFDKVRRQVLIELEKKERLNALVPKLSQMFSRPVVGITAPAIVALVTWTRAHLGESRQF